MRLELSAAALLSDVDAGSRPAAASPGGDETASGSDSVEGTAQLQAALTAAHSKLRKLSSLLDVRRVCVLLCVAMCCCVAVCCCVDVLWTEEGGVLTHTYCVRQELSDPASSTLLSVASNADELQRHRAELARLRAVARNSALRFKAHQQRQYASDRRALLSRAGDDGNGGGDGGGDGADGGNSAFVAGLRRRKQQMDAGTLLRKSQAVTSSLERTRGMMAMELERMGTVGDVLAEDNQLLRKTKEQHVGYGGDMGESKQAIARLRRRQRTDRIVIGAGLAFFMCVVLYVLKGRFWGR